MENSGLLKQRRWSITRKAQIIGTLVGGVGTLGFMLLGIIIKDQNGVRGGGIDTFTAIGLLLLTPADLILKLFGMEKLLSDSGTVSAVCFIGLPVLVNALVLCLIGTILGLIIEKLKKSALV